MSIPCLLYQNDIRSPPIVRLPLNILSNLPYLISMNKQARLDAINALAGYYNNGIASGPVGYNPRKSTNWNLEKAGLYKERTNVRTWLIRRKVDGVLVQVCKGVEEVNAFLREYALNG